MSRTQILWASAVSVIVSCALGYWLGGQSASEAYGHAYANDAVAREVNEARHDFMLLQAITEHKTDVALKIAQLRYYSRLILAAETAQKSSDPALQQFVKVQLAEAQKFQQVHPYEFPSEVEQRKWAQLVK
jgi:hypothetical protein